MTANRRLSNEQATDREALALEIDHLAEDLLDAAATIERLTRKYSEDVQKILRAQAESIKALAIEQGLPGKDDKGDTIIIDD